MHICGWGLTVFTAQSCPQQPQEFNGYGHRQTTMGTSPRPEELPSSGAGVVKFYKGTRG